MRPAGSSIVSLVLGAALGLGGCVVGGDDGGGGGDGDGGGGGDPDATQLSGTLAGGTLSGSLHLADEATVPAGATVTISAGSSLTAAEGKHITVVGTLLVDGTDGATVSMIPDEGAGRWGGVIVASGGAATLRHVSATGVDLLVACQAGDAACALARLDLSDVGGVIDAAATATLTESRVVGMDNGAINVRSGGDLTVSDSELMTSSHDLVTASGGTLVVEYSNIGGSEDTYEHCNFHIGRADSLTITRSNIVTGEYGIMIGEVIGASITYNNWEGNSYDVSPIGSTRSADFTHNWWASGAPNVGPEFDFTSPEGSRISDAGPRI